MIYYSMYYAVIALLFRVGIKCENHKGCIMLLEQLFDEKGLSEELEKAKEERIDKQYYTDYKATKEEAEEFIRNAQSFNIRIRQCIEMDEKRVEDIITRFGKL